MRSGTAPEFEELRISRSVLCVATVSEPTSAIVVRVPLPRGLAAMRSRDDWAAAHGVPPHVTILYPFVPAATLTGSVRKAVAEIAQTMPRFEVRFSKVGRWPGVVYLEPSPAERFSRLIELAVVRFPGHPPYGGAFAEVVPHLTIVENDGSALDAIAARASTHIPFTAEVRSLDVLVEDDTGTWRTRWRLPFRP
jgi:2'-5' RNA ligase